MMWMQISYSKEVRYAATARLDAPGTLHHVIIRGIECKEIVKDGHDRQNFVYRRGTIALETGTLIYAWTLMTNHTHIFFDSLQIILRYAPSNLLQRASNPMQNCHHRPGGALQRSPMDLQPLLPSIAPRAAGPCASTTSSPKCAISCGSTHQMA